MTGAAENGAMLLESKKKLISKTYLRNAWYVAAWSDDLVDGQLLGRTIMKEPVVLYRKADGNVAANVEPGDWIELRPRPGAARVVRLGHTTFYERVRRKLRLSDSAEIAIGWP